MGTVCPVVQWVSTLALTQHLHCRLLCEYFPVASLIQKFCCFASLWCSYRSIGYIILLWRGEELPWPFGLCIHKMQIIALWDCKHRVVYITFFITVWGFSEGNISSINFKFGHSNKMEDSTYSALHNIYFSFLNDTLTVFSRLNPNFRTLVHLQTDRGLSKPIIHQVHKEPQVEFLGV